MATPEINSLPRPCSDRTSLEKRPGILIVGSTNVGKRTLISQLLSVEFDDDSDSSTEVLLKGWTINTKYYSVDVSVRMAHLHDGFSVGALPMYNRLAALVMVFDMNDLSSFAALKDWVSRTDIQNFDILLCIGNKVDLVSGHPAYTEYRRRMLKFDDDSADPYQEFADYGILENEGSTLLGDEEQSSEMKKSCLEWCTEHNIEYIEACASNPDFDKCLSIDGDSQGVERLYGALSAHMWPGMILKSGDKITQPSLPENEDFSEEDSDFEFEYEILSVGAAEPWVVTEEEWVSATAGPSTEESGAQNTSSMDHDQDHETIFSKGDVQPSTSTCALQDEIINKEVSSKTEAENTTELDEGKQFDFENLEQLTSEIGNMRSNLRLMPDFQRKEMAAKLAMKMASMFGGSSEDEEEV